MKSRLSALTLALLCGVLPAPAQDVAVPAAVPDPNAASSNGYAADLETVRQAQSDLLDQARQQLASGRNAENRRDLEAAIAEMERARTALAAAGRSPERLTAALGAEQAAYQALLKLIPAEFRVSQSPNNGRGGGAGQPNPRELDQMEMTRQENRYETERQATQQPTMQQAEQLRTADRLRQLAQRQQDLNERLRELQTALQEARTEAERTELQRRLERLRDEERQMLAEVDELRQNLAQSPNAESLSEARRQLDQTRTEMQRAAESMRSNSASGALASGTRAEQTMRNVREDLRRQTSSRFADQMRDLRSQARQMAQREENIARDLDTLGNGGHQSLDDNAARRNLSRQMADQQAAFTNLLGGMRAVSEQAEATEPLLSQQLYDSLRRADQAHLDNLLDTGAQLVDRGFVPQAGQVEQTARQNINTLRQDIERAAESVLGNEADALRYAQQELNSLSAQVEREAATLRTNAASAAAAPGNTNLTANPNPGSPGGTNRPGQLAGAGQRSPQSTADDQTGNDRNQAGANSQESSPPASPGEQPGRSGRPEAGSNATAGAERAEGGQAGGSASREAASGDPNGLDRLRRLTQQLGQNNPGGGGLVTGPIMGNDFVNWADRMRDVEQVLDSADLRNQLAMVRERVGALRAEYRKDGRSPDGNVVRQQILVPMSQVRVWLQEELARADNARSLVPLDRDPVPEKYSEQVRRYYEKLGSAQ